MFMCDKMSSLLSVCNSLSQKGVEEEAGAATKCNDVQYRIWDDATHVEINVPHNNACQTLED